MTDIEQIQNMKDGETLYISQGGGNGAEIVLKNGVYVLYEIACCDDNSRYTDEFTDIYEMKKVYDSWT